MKKLATAALSLIFGIAILFLYSSKALRPLLKSYDIALLIAGIAICLISAVEVYFIFRKKKKSALPQEPRGDEGEYQKEPPRYERKREYISKSEMQFFHQLKKINPDKYEVLPQAALVNVIDKLTQTSYRNELFRVIDFLFVDASTYEPLLLVELNDRSHLKSDRQERDRKVGEICESAGMPLITFWTSEENTFAEIKKKVMKNILK